MICVEFFKTYFRLKTGQREHYENKLIAQSVMFENQIKPGLHKSSVRQTHALQRIQKAQTVWNWLCVDSVHVV